MIERGTSRVRFVVAAAVAVAVTFFLKTSDANLEHRTVASGLLTMAECLACHTDGDVKPINVCLGDHCLYAENHPLLHLYPPPGKERSFAMAGEITQAGCILEEGRITCLSCHDLTKPAPHLIRTGDALCLICHRDM